MWKCILVKFTFVCACKKYYRNKEYGLSLHLVKVDSFDFPYPYDGPWNSHLFSERPLVKIEFDGPAVQVGCCK
jgi:hypothetical protein